MSTAAIDRPKRGHAGRLAAQRRRLVSRFERAKQKFTAAACAALIGDDRAPAMAQAAIAEMNAARTALVALDAGDAARAIRTSDAEATP